MSTPRKIWKVSGGGTLSGAVHVHGNKNASLPCLAASLLLPAGEHLTLTNVPRISDVSVMCDILAVFGIVAEWHGPSTLTLHRTRYLSPCPEVPAELAKRIRGSVVLLGALATQYASFSLAKPGGDRIGGRPITAHITALEDLGYVTSEQSSTLIVKRQTTEIIGGTVLLIEQSVTATLMLLLYSASLGPGQHLTIIDAACEPHIASLCNLLISMGAHIEGMHSNLLTIRWPHGIQMQIAPVRLDDDFMEATTYAIAAAITKSDLTIPFHNAGITLALIDRYLGWMGIHTRLQGHQWEIFGATSTRDINPSLSVIKAEPWPRFPTDVMSMVVVLATQCTGTLGFVEYMYNDRFGFVQALRDIGAHIDQMPPHAIAVHGPTPLSGNESFLRPDIRSGAAMLLAALASSGTTILHDRKSIIERGYQDLPQTLAGLGAPILEIPPITD